MTAAPLSLHSPGLSSETRSSSSAHAKQVRSSAFQNEFAAQVADKGDKAEASAKTTTSAEPASDKPTPESLLRNLLMGRNSQPVELSKANKNEEQTPKPLPELCQETPSVKTPKSGESKTPSETMPDVVAPKAKTPKAAGRPEDDVILQPDSAELSQNAAILLSNAQDAAQVSTDAGRTRAAEKSTDKISSDASGTVAETADTSADPQPVAVTGDLSLALKVSGDTGKNAGHSAATNGGGLEPAANFRGQGHDIEQHADTSRGKDTAPMASAEIANAGSFKAEQAAQTETASAPTSATSQLEHAVELEKLRSQSVHGVHVQVESAANGKLDVRLVERAGQLSVTMRSADPAVTRALQEHSSDLTTRLALEQYHTELWKPAAAESSNGKSPFQQSSEQNGGAGGKSDSNADRKRKDQNPNWVDEMEQTPLFRKVTTTI